MKVRYVGPSGCSPLKSEDVYSVDYLYVDLFGELRLILKEFPDSNFDVAFFDEVPSNDKIFLAYVYANNIPSVGKPMICRKLSLSGIRSSYTNFRTSDVISVETYPSVYHSSVLKITTSSGSVYITTILPVEVI